MSTSISFSSTSTVSPTVSTSSSSSSSSAANPSDSSFPTSGQSGGVSSSLYLFTFLITILVLALISAALLGRAFFVRRRFQRRVEAAIRTGEPLPADAAEALGLIRPERRGKKEKKHGPMPSMWETEMMLDRSGGESGDLEKGWGDITPLSVLQFSSAPPPPPEGTTITFDGPLPRARFFGLITTQPFPRPQFDRGDTNMSLKPPTPVMEVPPPGTEVSVGLLIAMPFQEGGEGDRWTPPEGEDEELNVPEVVLGVMGCTLEESKE